MQRSEAKALGLKYYSGGKPCPKGHDSLRQTQSGGCVECGRANSLAYQRRVKPVQVYTPKPKAPPKPRALAIALGVKTYATGKPCAKCQTDSRYTNCGNCIECRKRRPKAPPKPYSERYIDALCRL